MPYEQKGSVMEWVIWVIVILLVIGIVWWLMRRGSSQSGSGSSLAASERTSSPPGDSLGYVPDKAPLAEPGIAASAAAAGTSGMAGAVTGPAAAAAAEGTRPAREGEDETADAPGPEEAFIAQQMATADEPEKADEAWRPQGEGDATETMASDYPPSNASGVDVDDWDTTAEPTGVTADDVVPADPGPGAMAASAPEEEAADREEWEATWSETPSAPAHHHEYTGPHSPTLPGAESAAAEAEASEEESRSGGPGGGHLATAHPYGEGSAAPASDGGGPEGYPVKADPESMTYHDEDTPGYADASAGVWFASAAHAEAAGFRLPRRGRL